MKTVRTDEVIKVPRDVAVCPICGAELSSLDIEEWEQDESDGTWYAVSPKANCSSEPSIDSKEWRAWHRWHYAMPYVDWLPVDIKIEKWLNENYRFDLNAPSHEEETEKLQHWNENAKRFA